MSAADHTDGATIDSNAAADIADLYAWIDAGETTLKLIMTVPGPVSEDIQYVFHVARVDTALNAATGPGTFTEIICVPGNDGAETECWAGDPSDGGDYVIGDATAADGVTSESENLRVHVGQHADPFFFYLDGFAQAIGAANFAAGDDAVNNLNLNSEQYPEAVDNIGAEDVFDAGADEDSCLDLVGGTDTAADVLVGILSGDYTWATDGTDTGCTDPAETAAVNSFASSNVDAVVVEVDLSLIPGTDPFLQVWASTHMGA